MVLSCPIDYRYGREAMKAIFSEEGKLHHLLQVEAALAKAHAALGDVPKRAAAEIARKATTQHVTPQRVKEIEADLRHDLMSVVVALTEACEGDAGKYVHAGATSYDIIDTANALQMRAAHALLVQELVRLEKALARLARQHKGTACVGRTHGQHAVPTTFGYKMATFLLETHRHRARLEDAKDRCLVGKMMGAVGTGAAFGGKALQVEREVARLLKIPMEEAPTQIVSRDRYNEYLGHIANLVTSLEKFATEIRNLQRNEIAEAAEGFREATQVGSSTMAQKRNPVQCEKVSGLARVTRAFLAPAYENAVQWHERDLANSSGERIILPHTFLLAHECVSTMADVFAGLQVYPERMRDNLERSATITAEAVMMALARAGMGRQDAHEVVRRAALRSDNRDEFRSRLLKEPQVRDLLSEADVDAALDPLEYLGEAAALVDRVLKRSGHARAA